MIINTPFQKHTTTAFTILKYVLVTIFYSFLFNCSSAFSKILFSGHQNIDSSLAQLAALNLSVSTPSFFTPGQDTVPPKRYVGHSLKASDKSTENLSGTANQRIKLRRVLIKKRRHIIIDSSTLLVNDTVAIQQLKLSIDLTGNGSNINTLKDSSGRLLLQYFNDNYHFNKLVPLYKKIDSGVIIGRININAQKVDNIQNDVNAAQMLPVDKQRLAHQWNGVITIDSSLLSVPSLGAIYTVDSQKIMVAYPNLLLNNFTVQDSAHNKLIANGGMAKSINSDTLNLQIKASNFTLLNVQKAIANQLYGFASIDAIATIKGSTDNPNIDGNITLNDNSNVTIILPQANANKAAENSMVRFIDKDSFALPHVTNPTQFASIKQTSTQPLHYNFNVTTSPHAAITFILDPATGDELRLHGEAKLKAGLDSTGKLILAGIYKLDSGFYTMNYQFLQRQFVVLPGSTITFEGVPADAEINITAAYAINTFAQDLLENEVSQITRQIELALKKEISFRVLLRLNGPIKNPRISFNIEMNGYNTTIDSRVLRAIQNKLLQLKQNVAATNKQVFSLLLYERFVGEQSTDFFKGSGTGDGGGFDDLAHESVSKFLSSALDNVAADLFKTLDVDHDLDNYRDYTNGDAQEKTEIKVGLTKSFIDNRRSINVGKDYGIDGQDASAMAAQEKGVGFLPDVTLNYKFTKDGRYSYRSYKKNQFEVTLDGYVTESGLSFMVIMDYDKFSDLLNKKK